MLCLKYWQAHNHLTGHKQDQDKDSRSSTSYLIATVDAHALFSCLLGFLLALHYVLLFSYLLVLPYALSVIMGVQCCDLVKIHDHVLMFS